MAVFVSNRQRGLAFDLLFLRRFARAALPLCLRRPGPGAAVLPTLERVDVLLVSDRRSAALHERFLGAPGPTDVITFQHGEIVIASGVARRQARAHRQPLTRELCRYLVHGLLHLNGHEDARPLDAARMWRSQETVLRAATRALAL